ncbi:MAG: SAM-dependent methyltransferase [Dehalococcoidia bacterium]
MKTEFEAATENAALADAIRAAIAERGAVPFRDFMDLALYHPQHGYYCSRRDKMGREGDYLTSPEVSPVFGVLVGRQLREMWQAMGSPARFDVVEAGPGSGRLARDILRWARNHTPGLGEALAYTLVEVSEPMIDRQRETLAEESERVAWRTGLPDGIEGCILSNELLDSFPVHRVEVRDGELLEVFVDWDGSAFVEELRPPSTPELARYFEDLGLLPGEGCRAEVNLAAPQWLRAAGDALARGFVLTFDYGYAANELYAPWRSDGTLLCFHRHNPSADPYVRIGRQDITAHVDFTTVRAAGESAGLQTLGLVSQSELLTSLGIADALSPPAEGDTDLEGYYARRRAVSELLDPAGLGRIRVLAQSKGLVRPRLSGLEGLNGA